MFVDDTQLPGNGWEFENLGHGETMTSATTEHGCVVTPDVEIDPASLPEAVGIDLLAPLESVLVPDLFEHGVEPTIPLHHIIEAPASILRASSLDLRNDYVNDAGGFPAEPVDPMLPAGPDLRFLDEREGFDIPVATEDLAGIPAVVRGGE